MDVAYVYLTCSRIDCRANSVEQKGTETSRQGYYMEAVAKLMGSIVSGTRALIYTNRHIQ